TQIDKLQLPALMQKAETSLKSGSSQPEILKGIREARDTIDSLRDELDKAQASTALVERLNDRIVASIKQANAVVGNSALRDEMDIYHDALSVVVRGLELADKQLGGVLSAEQAQAASKELEQCRKAAEALRQKRLKEVVEAQEGATTLAKAHYK